MAKLNCTEASRSALPQSWHYGASILTGIGFTMSLFVGTLGFDDETIMVQVRLGVLIASLLSGIAAIAILALASSARSTVLSPAAE